MYRYELDYKEFKIIDTLDSTVYDCKDIGHLLRLVESLNRNYFIYKEKVALCSSQETEINHLKLEKELLQRVVEDLETPVYPWSNSSVKRSPMIPYERINCIEVRGKDKKF